MENNEKRRVPEATGPEAADGEPLACVMDEDSIIINAEHGVPTLDVSDEDMMDTIVEGLKPIKHKRLSEEVAQSLEDYIFKNKLSPNEKLPSERSLCELFHVGSRTVREALKTIEAKGIIKIIQGKGAFVAKPDFSILFKNLANLMDYTSDDEKSKLSELMYFRRIIEIGVVKQVARDGAPDGYLAEMKKNLEGQVAAYEVSDLNQYSRLDAEYHEILIRCSKNSILINIYSNLHYMLRVGMEKTGIFPGSFKDGLREHNELFKAISERNPDLAVQVLDKHLESSRKKLEDFLFSPAS